MKIISGKSGHGREVVGGCASESLRRGERVSLSLGSGRIEDRASLAVRSDIS